MLSHHFCGLQRKHFWTYHITTKILCRAFHAVEVMKEKGRSEVELVPQQAYEFPEKSKLNKVKLLITLTDANPSISRITVYTETFV